MGRDTRTGDSRRAPPDPSRVDCLTGACQTTRPHHGRTLSMITWLRSATSLGWLCPQRSGSPAPWGQGLFRWLRATCGIWAANYAAREAVDESDDSWGRAVRGLPPIGVRISRSSNRRWAKATSPILRPVGVNPFARRRSLAIFSSSFFDTWTSLLGNVYS